MAPPILLRAYGILPIYGWALINLKGDDVNQAIYQQMKKKFPVDNRDRNRKNNLN
jgi:hypothetical protein